MGKGILSDLIQEVKRYRQRQRSLIKSEKWKQASEQQHVQQVEEQYEQCFGKKLDWNHLEAYTEKMQWAKLYDTDDRKVICADKYLVRDWVRERIGAQYLIPLLGVYDRYSDIEFKGLPNQFVIKSNHGAGDIYVVRNKAGMTQLEKFRMRSMIEYGLRFDLSSRFCEMHYGKINPKIIVEQFVDSGKEDIPDFKFLCFDGVPYFVWVDIGRSGDHRRNVYDMNWQLQDWIQHYPNTDEPIPCPPHFDEMVQLARRLSEGFAHVRIDLYNVDGRIYFGEMTFTNGGGMKRITPEEADKMLGNLWKIDTSVRNSWNH